MDLYRIPEKFLSVWGRKTNGLNCMSALNRGGHSSVKWKRWVDRVKGGAALPAEVKIETGDSDHDHKVRCSLWNGIKSNEIEI